MNPKCPRKTKHSGFSWLRRCRIANASAEIWNAAYVCNHLFLHSVTEIDSHLTPIRLQSAIRPCTRKAGLSDSQQSVETSVQASLSHMSATLLASLPTCLTEKKQNIVTQFRVR